MGWEKIEPRRNVTEKVLQDMYAAPTDHRYLLAGAPSWLLPHKEVEQRSYRNARGYSWQSDVEHVASDGEYYVLELKHAAKYEPLALAEVLHHAQLLRKELKRRVHPAIVCTYSSWLRMALWHLKELYGIEPVKYCEALVFEDPQRPKSHMIWFDLPFAQRERSEAPTCVPATLREVALHWYTVKETSSWIASRQALPSADEVAAGAFPFLEGKVLQLTQFEAGHLLWLGEEAANETSSADGLRQDYFLHTEGAGIDPPALQAAIDHWLATQP